MGIAAIVTALGIGSAIDDDDATFTDDRLSGDGSGGD